VLGEEAVTLSTRYPDLFVKRLRDLIGRPADDPTVQAVLAQSTLNYTIVPDERRGTVRIQLPGFEQSFTIEELVVCGPRHS
jgi:hypoxia up-regulated 1